VITISAFESVPEFAQGLVRDLRVRWRKQACPTGRVFLNSAIKTSRTIVPCSPSGRCRSSRKTARSL
jgi:hypothetical protein